MQVCIATQIGLFGEDKAIRSIQRESKKTSIRPNPSTPQEQFLQGVEERLGLRRIKGENGQWVLDSSGLPLLRLDSRPGKFSGRYSAANMSDSFKEMLVIACLNKAASLIAPLFEEHLKERLVWKGIQILTHRLRYLRGDDCPQFITKCFVDHYAQQDLTMNERTGETLRNNHRLANAEARRRAAGVKARNFRKIRTVQGVEAEQPIVGVESDSDAPKVIKLTVDSLLGKRHASEEVYASDDSAELAGKTDNSFILDED